MKRITRAKILLTPIIVLVISCHIPFFIRHHIIPTFLPMYITLYTCIIHATIIIVKKNSNLNQLRWVLIHVTVVLSTVIGAILTTKEVADFLLIAIFLVLLLYTWYMVYISDPL